MDIPIGGEHAATARAYSNIALAKYWGKRDAALNIPAVGSISITLDALHTDTTVAFDPDLEADREQQDEEEPGPESGHGDPDLRDEHRQVVAGAAVAARGVEAER